MNAKNSTLSDDLAQRIAEALSRTSDPKKSSDVTNDNDLEVIGIVPLHLRHLHNLLADLLDEVASAEAECVAARKRLNIVRDLFFATLADHVPNPQKGSTGVMVLEDWSVVVMVGDDEERGDPSAELFGRLGGLFGGRRGPFG